MEMQKINANFWFGRHVLVTGHTGFKGGWLCLCLKMLGAEVHGYSLEPSTNPSMFEVARIDGLLASSEMADIRSYEALSRTLRRVRPEIIFHLAAQPLVRYSYSAPVETYAVNVMGTVNLMEAIREIDSVRAVINVTTDKCYENREWPWGYRENDPLGGHDPYSSSKGCAELVTSAYRSSFFAGSGVAVATARAGNVIGGGDWATDRLLPDFLRSYDAGETLVIRSPNAIRPWQHVLAPLYGYLQLAQSLVVSGEQFAQAWNFGPDDCDAQSVERILEQLLTHLADMRWRCDTLPQPHEATFLKLDSSKSRAQLRWAAPWRLAKALEMTVAWHLAWRQGVDMQAFSRLQIQEYLATVTS
jgi:CDP-glucose 4,6-dehydratase